MGRVSKMSNIQRIVIVGGGAGGLELASRLGNKLGKKNKAEIILIDRSPIHIWKPLLHEVAAGTLNSYDDEISYLAYASEHYFQFCLGTMHKLNREKKEIILNPMFGKNNQVIIPERVISYDILIIAVGSISNDFHIPGVQEHCLKLDTSEQALAFQQYLIKTLMGLPYQENTQNQPFNIAVIGAGATGVELTAELHYALGQMSIYGFAFDPSKITFNLIEAADRLLPALPQQLSATVQQRLQRLGIIIHTDEQVSEITSNGIITKSGKFIPALIKVWAAGIKAPEFLKNLDGLSVNKINQLLVRPTLQTTLDDNIFAFGDCAYCPQQNSDKPVPARAQAAHQQANCLAIAIVNLINKKSLPIFHYNDHGSLISLSHYQTVGNLMGRRTKNFLIEGMLARIAYLSLYRGHQVALYGLWRVALLMFANLLTHQIRPRLKLH